MTTMANRHRRRSTNCGGAEPASWWRGFRAGACIALLFAVACLLVIARILGVA